MYAVSHTLSFSLTTTPPSQMFQQIITWLIFGLSSFMCNWKNSGNLQLTHNMLYSDKV